MSTLCSLQFIGLDRLGPAKHGAGALVWILSLRKTSDQTVEAQHLSMLRHSDVVLCPLNAMAVWLLRRFELGGEDLPDFFEPGGQWKDRHVLVSVK